LYPPSRNLGREEFLRKFLLLCLAVAAGCGLAQTGARYLVITADALYGSIQPLAQWKQATGLPTMVVRLSQIGTDTLAIKNYIINAYNSWPIKPEYVLLVGSPSLLPARIYQNSGNPYSTDNVYADMGGTVEAELAVGRLPAASEAQLDVMVAKTLKYEYDPDLTDSVWMRRLTTVIRETGDPDDSVYWSDVRNAAFRAQAAGFVGCDSFSSFRGNTSTDVQRSLNQGAGFLLYRGSANSTWYPPFDSLKPGHLTSTNKLTIVTSITCQTLSLDPADPPMYGDSFMRAGAIGNLRGAVAFFGNTHPAAEVAPIRSAAARGFYNGLFAENIWKLGRTALRAKHQMYVEFPDSVVRRDYRGFNLLGDPDLGVWTATPRLLAVQHPTEILPGPQDIHVTVKSSAIPVEGALVCASMGASVYVTGYTNSDGDLTLTVSPPDSGHLRLVVTGQNLYPYDGSIRVLSTSVAEPSSGVAPGARLAFAPNPFRSVTAIRLTSHAAGHSAARLDLYDPQGRQVLSQHVSGISPVLSAPALPAGVYVGVLSDRLGATLARGRLLKTN
jgi:hypothetical protein